MPVTVMLIGGAAEEFPEKRFLAGGATHGIPHVLVRESLGDLAQQLQVLFGGLFRHQQHKHQINGFIVHGIKIHGFLKFKKGTYGVTAVPGTAVGNGYAFADSGTAQPFPGNEVVKQFIGSELGSLLGNKPSSIFKNTLFAGTFNICEGALRRDDVGYIHEMKTLKV